MYFLQNDAKIKALDPINQVQGASRGHLTASASISLSQSVLGKAMLLGLPFLNQIASETFFGLTTLVGGLCKWQPYDQFIIKTEG